MNRRNYQKELDGLILREKISGRVPRLLLHSCCAPCSSYVLEYLSQFFEITVYYYNPNIYPSEEFEKRVKEQRCLIKQMDFTHPVNFMAGEYKPEDFYQCVKGMEYLQEGGGRCFTCYELRMREAAKIAVSEGFDYFTTTLTISPMKNAEKINEIGERLEKEYQVSHLPSDFKKREGYKRSIELSFGYGLYRQDYCGCVYSMRKQEEREKEREKDRSFS